MIQHLYLYSTQYFFSHTHIQPIPFRILKLHCKLWPENTDSGCRVTGSQRAMWLEVLLSPKCWKMDRTPKRSIPPPSKMWVAPWGNARVETSLLHLGLREEKQLWFKSTILHLIDKKRQSYPNSCKVTSHNPAWCKVHALGCSDPAAVQRSPLKVSGTRIWNTGSFTYAR